MWSPVSADGELDRSRRWDATLALSQTVGRRKASGPTPSRRITSNRVRNSGFGRRPWCVMNSMVFPPSRVPLEPARSAARRPRIWRDVLVLGAVCVSLVGCDFDQLYGVAQLNEEVVTGLIEANEEGDRIYVGTVYSGDHLDAIARVRSINPSTGAAIATAPIYGGSHRYRAIAEDRSDDSVWMLRDNGRLDHRTKDFGFLSSDADFFTPPSGTLQRFCDLEQLPNGHFVATGIYEAGGDLRGFWNYVQPDPAFPGDWYSSWTTYAVDPGADTDRACPRVSHETNSGKTVFLQPYWHYNGTTEHRVSQYETYSWNGGAATPYYGLSYDGHWTTPVSSKWMVADITAEYDVVVVARQHVSDASPGYLELFEQGTGVSLDTRTLERARAVDFSLSPQTSTDAGSVLWWGGRESETGSGFELGALGFSN